MKTTLKPYMGYSNLAGSPEGAILIFAPNSRKAKSTGWSEPSFIHFICDSFLDFRVNIIKDSQYLYNQTNQGKLSQNQPHIIESPLTCNGCDMWGMELNNMGYCESCWEEFSDNEWKPAN